MKAKVNLKVSKSCEEEQSCKCKKMIFEDQINVWDNPKYGPMTFRNKNVTFGQKSQVSKAKNNGHQNLHKV